MIKTKAISVAHEPGEEDVNQRPVRVNSTEAVGSLGPSQGTAVLP